MIDAGLFAIGSDWSIDDHGVAYVRDAVSGERLHTRNGDALMTIDEFGLSVAMDQGILVVGAPRAEHEGSNSGAAYIFDAETGERLHKLVASDADASDEFGFSVSVHGGIAIVGAHRDDDFCPEDPWCQSGAANTFDLTTGVQFHKLMGSDAEEAQYFGTRVAIRNGTAIIGAVGNDGPCAGDPEC
jgi:hypothetical protein